MGIGTAPIALQSGVAGWATIAGPVSARGRTDGRAPCGTRCSGRGSYSHVFEDELNKEQSEDLISKITDAVLEVTSDNLRDVTWVIIEEVKSGHWGVGGNALGLDDVKKIMAST